MPKESGQHIAACRQLPAFARECCMHMMIASLDSSRMGPSASSRGQALILALISLVALVVGLLVLFNTGQVVSKKVRLTNAADAAAYSSAVQQARAFNTIAYMNRAVVANQIVMAQMVSWYSWTNFAISATHHFKQAVQDMAVVFDVTVIGAEIGAYLQEVVSTLNDVEKGLKKGRDIEQKVFRYAAKVIAQLDNGYATTSRLLANLSAVDTTNLARKIVKLNAPHATIPAQGLGLLGLDAAKARNYVAHYSIPASGHDNKGANRLLNVVMEARDPFSRQRNGHLGLPSDTDPGSYPPGSAGFFLNKKGGSDLVDYHNWVGIDTLSLHVWYPICFTKWGKPETCHIYEPVAWGGGAIVDHRDRSFKELATSDKGWQGPYRGNPPGYADKRSYQPYSGALLNREARMRVLKNPAEGGKDKAWITAHSPFGNIAGGTIGLPDYDDIKPRLATVPYRNGKTAEANGVQAIDVGPQFTVLVEESTNALRTSSHIAGMGGAPDFDIPEKTAKNKLTAVGTAQVYFERSHQFPNFADGRRELGNLFSPYWQARRIQTPCITRQALAASYGTTASCTP